MLVLILLSAALTSPSLQEPSDDPLQRSSSFLQNAARSWRASNGCFSCHNTGDAVRAVAPDIASGAKLDPPMEEIRTFLGQPRSWHENGGDSPFEDQALSDLQFALAAEATRPGFSISDDSSWQSSLRLLSHLEENGSYAVDADALVGSPVTYGRTLATVLARRQLQSNLARKPERPSSPLQARSRENQVRLAVAEMDQWIAGQRPKSVLDSAAVLLDWSARNAGTSSEQWRHCIDVLKKGQRPGGGFGPFVHSREEPFDTALVILALDPFTEESGELRVLAEKAQDALIGMQRKDGSWDETTRPAGAESYAQRVSTTAWAHMALTARRKSRSQ